MHPLTVPTGATALRPTWADLPSAVRELVEDRTGAPVVEALSQRGGYTPGFASRLLLADGRRVFVKAADEQTQPMFADAYRTEAALVRRLPERVPAPRLQWSHDGDGWVIVAFDDIDGRHPARPWVREQLDRVLDALSAAADALTPVPAALDLPSFGSEFGALPSRWEGLAHLPHAEEAYRLARHGLACGAGDSVAHTDVRDDNLLLEDSGTVWVCDWNFLCAGPAWFDTLCVLVSGYGDGHDADAILASSTLASTADPEAIDGALAMLAGHFLTSAEQVAPETSPYLRAHQRWYADVTWAWLGERRGWT